MLLKDMSFAEFVIRLELQIFKNPVQFLTEDKKPNYVHTFFETAESIINHDGHNYLINCPPRIGKSTFMGIYLIAYGFAVNESSKFLYLHIEEHLASTQVTRLKTILDSYLYKSLTDTRFASFKGWKTLKTTKGGLLQTRSILSNVTGLGAGTYDHTKFSGALIFDEPHQASHYYQPFRMREVIDKFFSNVITRRQNINVPFIIIGHRISNSDLFSKLLEEDNMIAFDWKVIKIPAVRNGVSISPNVFTLEYLNSVKNRTPEVFYAQYMQDPITRTDIIFNVDAIKNNDINKATDIFTPEQDILISIDPNGNSKTSPDTTGIVICSMFYRGQSKIPDLLIKEILDQKQPNMAMIQHHILYYLSKYKNRLRRVFIESHTFGHALYDGILSYVAGKDFKTSLFVPSKRTIEKRTFMLKVAFYAHTHLYIDANNLTLYEGLFEEMRNITVENKLTKDDVTDALSEILMQVYEKKSVPCFRHTGDKSLHNKSLLRLSSLYA